MSLGGRFTQIANGDNDLKKEQKLASTEATTESAGKTSHIIAKKIGISPASYERSQKIKQLGTDDQKQSLREGRRSITQVYNQVRKQEIKNQLIRQAQEAAKNNPNYANDSRVRLIHADFRTLDQASIPDGSIHLVFTDPPYSRNWLQFFEPLGKLAFRVLEDGGSLVLYAGHYALPEILDLVGKSGLRYWWEIAIKHNGASRLVHHQHVFVKWKPLLWFVKGDELRTPDSIVDLIESEPPDKIFHDWQQSPVEAQHVISKLTIEGDVVLDPLMASGTTGIAALKEGRKFIGIDKDSEVLQLKTGENIMVASLNIMVTGGSREKAINKFVDNLQLLDHRLMQCQ